MRRFYNFLWGLIIDFIYFFSKFWRKFILLFLFFLFSLILFSNLAINLYSNEKIHSKLENIPIKKIALVLGTSKYIGGDIGKVNLFYKERINTANELYESGKINFLILSGTNDSRYYNEPEIMKKDLMNLGVPENKIYLDYAGFRTLDSVVRAKEIFFQDDIIIISQKFHLQRAIFIAGLNNINAVGYSAKDPPFMISIKVFFREIISRIILLWDILIQKEPKFYGEKIEIK